jgi:LmbE family N-acetylglucosaminyl deacetylase
MWPCPTSLEIKHPANSLSHTRVLVVTAHPDDESMGSGLLGKLGLIAGTEVKIVVLTNGDKGSGNTSVTSAALAATRAKEMHAAAAALNATAVLLGYEDGNLVNTYEQRLRVAAQIRLFQPTLLVTMSPNRNFGHYQLGSEHKDHAHAGGIALDCFYPLARDFLQFPELWQPTLPAYRSVLDQFAELDAWNKTTPLAGWKVPEAYIMSTEQFGLWGPPRYENVVVSLTAADLERKVGFRC